MTFGLRVWSLSSAFCKGSEEMPVRRDRKREKETSVMLGFDGRSSFGSWSARL